MSPNCKLLKFDENWKKNWKKNLKKLETKRRNLKTCKKKKIEKLYKTPRAIFKLNQLEKNFKNWR